MEAWFRWFSDFSGFQFGAFFDSRLIFRGVTIAYHYWPVKIANQACPPRANVQYMTPPAKNDISEKFLLKHLEKTGECVDFQLILCPYFLDMILGKPKGEFPQMAWKVSKSSSNNASLFSFRKYTLVKVDGSTPKFGDDLFSGPWWNFPRLNGTWDMDTFYFQVVIM